MNNIIIFAILHIFSFINDESQLLSDQKDVCFKLHLPVSLQGEQGECGAVGKKGEEVGFRTSQIFLLIAIITYFCGAFSTMSEYGDVFSQGTDGLPGPRGPKGEQVMF